jgi:hypothetical protein
MNEQIVLTLAQAILANTKVLQSLVDTLPHEVKQQVQVAVVAASPNVAPVAAPAPTPVVPVMATPAPMAVAAPAPVMASPSSLMPPPPVFSAPVAAPAPTLGKAPFHDGKTMIDYIMGVYKQLGQAKGSAIQGVLDSLGTKNINDVTAAHYDALYHGVEEMKARLL